jgi:broad specificity phosphatase PhoE
MALLAAEELLASTPHVGPIISSPLERAVASAQPIARLLKREATVDDALIEASSRLQGGQFAMKLSIVTKPAAWRYLVNPLRPSWGEPFVEVLQRTRGVFERFREEPPEGDVVLVGHQLPI